MTIPGATLNDVVAAWLAISDVTAGYVDMCATLPVNGGPGGGAFKAAWEELDARLQVLCVRWPGPLPPHSTDTHDHQYADERGCPVGCPRRLAVEARRWLTGTVETVTAPAGG